jgi:formylglycine-generating enzyme required for sulfatase activity
MTKALLMAALGDEDESVARVAQQALVRIGEGAVESLIGALGNPIQRVRSTAASALDTIVDFRVDERWCGLLITALGDEDENVARVAQQGLIRMGWAVVGRLVKVFVNERGSRRRWVAEALQAVGEFPVEASQARDFIEALADHDETVAATAQQALVQLGEAATDSLLDVISTQATPLRVRIGAWNALGQIGDPRFHGSYIEPDLTTIPEGGFWMGSETTEAWHNERPVHRVHMAQFHMARFPVTNAQFECFVEAGGYDEERYWTDTGLAWRQERKYRWPRGWEDGRFPPERANHPVVNVTWYEALAYTRWLAEATGKPYRLPTEAEWEKAARGAQDRREYPWGDKFDPRKANLNIGEEKVGGTTPVGIYPDGASPYGIMDMSGNVWEWCSSLSWGYPYAPNDGREDLEAEGYRVLRGGSWFPDDEKYARCSVRIDDHPSFFDDHFGFRVVVESTAQGSSVSPL